MNARLLRIAFTCLTVGACIYAFARPIRAWFVPPALHAPLFAHSWIAAISGSLPAAAHVLALSLLTLAALGASARAAALAPATWALINIAFEIGQHASVSPFLSSVLPQRFDDLWFLDQLRPYFTHGTFDPLDIAGALAGALVARFLIANMKAENCHASA